MGVLAAEPDAASDVAWVQALRAGEGEAVDRLRTLLRRRLAALLHVAGHRHRLHEADLDDFTQDACIRVLGRLDGFRGEARFATWATTVAVRVAYTALRRRGPATHPAGDDIEVVADTRSGGLPPSGAAQRRELHAALRTAIANHLTPRQREVVLWEMNGTPQVRIADRLGTTPGAIYKMMHDARKKLREELLAAGFDASDLPAGGAEP